jgi:hypothetical protein
MIMLRVSLPKLSTCDYLNRLTQSVVGGATTTYGYDVNGERVLLGSTVYPFNLYNVLGSAIAKHIFANGEPIADIQGSTSTASQAPRKAPTSTRAILVEATPTLMPRHPMHLRPTPTTTTAICSPVTASQTPGIIETD